MAINRSSISAQSITDNTDVAIRMALTRPDPNVIIDPPLKPSIMIGYYNNITDTVELFVTNPSGTRFLPVV